MKYTFCKLFSILALSCTTAYAQYPADFNLKDLEKEIIKKEDCIKLACSSINKVTVKEADAQKGTIKLLISVDARVDSLIELPIDSAQVNIENILVNKKLWYAAEISTGGKINTVVLQGTNEIELDLFVKGQSLTLKNYKKTIRDISGSKLIKINNDGSIEFIKENNIKQEEKLVNKFTTNPFFVVNRTIVLEQKWKVRTTVNLLDAVGNNIAKNLSIDALPGESVLSGDIKNENGKININITNDSVSWESVLEEKPQLNITGSKDYLQKITFISNSDWLFNFKNLEPVNKSEKPNYTSSYDWIFWPQDKLTLNISKPLAIKGQTIAVQSVNVNLDTNKSPHEIQYNINLKSSLGTKVKIPLPEKLKLISVDINNKNIPFKEENNLIYIDVNAGKTLIKLTFDMLEPISLVHNYPQLKLDMPSNNYSYSINTPKQRWVLWTSGSNLKDSILLWGILISCFIFSYPLAKAIKSPLGWKSWTLLFFGLSQAGLWGIFFIVLWFALINYKYTDNSNKLKRFNFNAVQVLIVGLTIMVFSLAIQTVAQGLLNYPNMFIEGLNSSSNSLYWYSEQAEQFNPTLFSLPIWTYRVFMFMWSIWFALNIMNWLKWAWEGFNKSGIWIAAPAKPAEVKLGDKLTENNQGNIEVEINIDKEENK